MLAWLIIFSNIIIDLIISRTIWIRGILMLFPIECFLKISIDDVLVFVRGVIMCREHGLRCFHKFIQLSNTRSCEWRQEIVIVNEYHFTRIWCCLKDRRWLPYLWCTWKNRRLCPTASIILMILLLLIMVILLQLPRLAVQIFQ